MKKMTRRQKQELEAARGTQPVLQQSELKVGWHMALHAGPLPSPETLKNYEDLVPGSVARIISMAEKDQDFVHEVERSKERERNRTILLGQIFGFLLGICGLAAAVTLAVMDKNIAAAGIFLGSVGTLIVASVWSKTEKRSQAKQANNFVSS